MGLAGVFEKSIKKARKKLGVYTIMIGSIIGTLVIGYFLPENENYWWLGVAATGGILIHILGDMITKMGIPMMWPIKFKGKRWYDVSLPSFMRISAGGWFEQVVLFPIFSVVTTISFFLCIPPVAAWMQSFFK